MAHVIQADAQYKLPEGAMEQMRKLVHQELTAKQEPLEYLSDDACLRRLLVAREGQVQPAFEMWRKLYAWRKEYQVDNISEQDVQAEYQTGKAFWHGHDKENKPCVIILPRHHIPNDNGLDQTVRLAVYLLEKGIHLANENGVEKLCVIYDREGMTRKNFDMGLIGMMKQLLQVLQDFYAERLGRFYIINVNWLFWGMYKIISPFLSARTTDKIKVLRNTSELLQYFDKEQLLPEHGGTSNYVHPYPSNGSNAAATSSASSSADAGNAEVLAAASNK